MSIEVKEDVLHVRVCVEKQAFFERLPAGGWETE